MAIGWLNMTFYDELSNYGNGRTTGRFRRPTDLSTSKSTDLYKQINKHIQTNQQTHTHTLSKVCLILVLQ